MAFVQAYHKLCKWADWISEHICLVMLLLMVLLTGAQIICRVFFQALSWSEELARYLLVWSSIIGASCVYRRSGHISVNVVQDLFPDTVKHILKIVVHLICCVFFAMMIYFGSIYMVKMSAQLSPAMRLPMGYMYAVVPVGGILMLLQAVDAILGLLFDKPAEKEAKKEEEA